MQEDSDDEEIAWDKPVKKIEESKKQVEEEDDEMIDEDFLTNMIAQSKQEQEV